MRTKHLLLIILCLQKLTILQAMEDVTKTLNNLTLSTGNSNFDNIPYSVTCTQGKRPSMEDTHQVYILPEEGFAFFGVFDGHSGKETANYLRQNLLNNILTSQQTDFTEQITDGFLITNEKILNSTLLRHQGSTAITAFLIKNHLIIANVGDSRAVVSENGLATFFSAAHNFYLNLNEIFRIQALDGFFKDGRINGLLEPTRSFGDWSLRKFITPNPEITEIELSDECDYLILASDGLWDAIKAQEAVDVVKTCNQIREAGKELVNLALQKGSEDNITVIMVNIKNIRQKFQKYKK